MGVNDSDSSNSSVILLTEYVYSSVYNNSSVILGSDSSNSSVILGSDNRNPSVILDSSSNNSSVDPTEASSDDPYEYSSVYGCWVKKNVSLVNATGDSKYCYYGDGVAITLSVFLVISMVLALGGNIMVILTIVRHQGMRTRTNLLLANLAVADILVAVLDMPIALTTIINGDWIFSHIFCDLNGFTVGLGLMLSIHTLMWISIHKFVSITRPFAGSVTPRKIIMMIFAAWIWTIFFNLTPTPIIGLTDTEYKVGSSQCGPGVPRVTKQFVHSGINTLFNLIIPFIVMTYCYYRIFKEVKDHLRRMRDFADVSACNSLIEQKRITETLCIVLLVFLLFWMPYIVYSLSLVFLGSDYVPVIFNPIAYLFGYMNSACNPIIYALRSPSFRRGFTEIICGNTQRGYSGSLYGRRNMSTGSVRGRMVVSFKRPVYGNQVTEKEKMLHQHTIREKSKFQQTRISYPAMSTMDNEALANAPYDETSQHDRIMKLNQKELEDSGRKAVVYKNMHESNGKKASRGTNEYPESVLEDMTCSSISREFSDQNFPERESDLSNPLENGQELYLNEKSPVDIEIESNGERKRHSSLNPQTIKMASNNCGASTSQPDISLLPTRNLNINIDGERISNSNYEILDTTLEIQDNHLRSVSVGDVRVTCSASNSKICGASPRMKGRNIRKELPKHSPNLKYPFVWQPSVDNIFGSPTITRRDFHLRKGLLRSKLNEMGNRGNCWNIPKEKTCSTGSRHHLGVSSLLTNVKKSLTDLFHLDDESLLNSGSELQDSSGARVSISSEERTAGCSKGRADGYCEDSTACVSERGIAKLGKTPVEDSEEGLTCLDSVCHK